MTGLDVIRMSSTTCVQLRLDHQVGLLWVQGACRATPPVHDELVLVLHLVGRAEIHILLEAESAVAWVVGAFIHAAAIGTSARVGTVEVWTICML